MPILLYGNKNPTWRDTYLQVSGGVAIQFGTMWPNSKRLHHPDDQPRSASGMGASVSTLSTEQIVRQASAPSGASAFETVAITPKGGADAQCFPGISLKDGIALDTDFPTNWLEPGDAASQYPASNVQDAVSPPSRPTSGQRDSISTFAAEFDGAIQDKQYPGIPGGSPPPDATEQRLPEAGRPRGDQPTEYYTQTTILSDQSKRPSIVREGVTIPSIPLPDSDADSCDDVKPTIPHRLSTLDSPRNYFSPEELGVLLHNYTTSPDPVLQDKIEEHTILYCISMEARERLQSKKNVTELARDLQRVVQLISQDIPAMAEMFDQTTPADETVYQTHIIQELLKRAQKENLIRSMDDYSLYKHIELDKFYSEQDISVLVRTMAWLRNNVKTACVTDETDAKMAMLSAQEIIVALAEILQVLQTPVLERHFWDDIVDAISRGTTPQLPDVPDIEIDDIDIPFEEVGFGNDKAVD